MNIKEEIKKLVPDEKTYHQVMYLCYEYALEQVQDLSIKLGLKEKE